MTKTIAIYSLLWYNYWGRIRILDKLSLRRLEGCLPFGQTLGLRTFAGAKVRARARSNRGRVVNIVAVLHHKVSLRSEKTRPTQPPTRLPLRGCYYFKYDLLKERRYLPEKFLYNFLTSFEVSCRYLFKNLCFGRRVFSSDTLFDVLFSGWGIYLEAFWGRKRGKILSVNLTYLNHWLFNIKVI